MLRIVKATDQSFEREIRPLRRRHRPAAALERDVAQIVDAVRQRGDGALVEFTRRFDRVSITSPKLRVAPAEVARARSSLDADTLAALRASLDNIRSFARNGLRHSWSAPNAQGATVGERFDPLRRVGVYVPGGLAPLVSSALMTAGFASAAGVPEIVAVTPPGPGGTIHPALLAALDLAGATEIYRVGGAHAIAALAHGTRTIRAVDKIFGPGNAYVVEAKRQVFGLVAVDLLPGPSEILVIADASARPEWIAADLLAQAEHGTDSVAVLLTPSARLASAVARAAESQLGSLPRQHLARRSLDTGGWIVQTRSIAQAIELANDFAPEHLSIVARDDERIAARILTAGAIFLGPHSAVVAGDFLAGPSHELPTGGAGKSFPGLTVDQFQRRTSVVRIGRDALERSYPILERFSAMEGLEAHRRSAAIRIDRP